MWACTHVLASFALLSGHAKQINMWPTTVTPLIFAFPGTMHINIICYISYVGIAYIIRVSPKTRKSLFVEDAISIHFSLSRSCLGTASLCCEVDSFLGTKSGCLLCLPFFFFRSNTTVDEDRRQFMTITFAIPWQVEGFWV